jgi:hypothetical protein
LESIKTKPGTFTYAEREQERADARAITDTGNHIYRWFNSNTPGTVYYIPKYEKGSPERLKRDNDLWNTFPPLNFMHASGSARQNFYDAPLTCGNWQVVGPFTVNWQTYFNFQSGWTIKEQNSGLTYTMDDLKIIELCLVRALIFLPDGTCPAPTRSTTAPELTG